MPGAEPTVANVEIVIHENQIEIPYETTIFPLGELL